MIRGLYSAASSMVSAMRQMEVLTNNVANAQTTGFKQDRTATATFAEQLVIEQSALNNGQRVGPLTLSNVAQEPVLDLSQGALRETGRSLDLALEGTGFFAVQTEGGVRYTRDGSFTRDPDGHLRTDDGGYLLGQNGPVQLPEGQLGIGPEGQLFINEQAVDTLRVVELDPGQIKRVGNNQFALREEGADPEQSTTAAVRQGYIETSNVDMTGAQTTMLELQRAYEAAQRMIQYQDEMMGKAVNEIARPN